MADYVGGQSTRLTLANSTDAATVTWNEALQNITIQNLGAGTVYFAYDGTVANSTSQSAVELRSSQSVDVQALAPFSVITLAANDAATAQIIARS